MRTYLKIIAIAALGLLAACDAQTKQPDVKQVQAQKAQEAANSLNFTDNSEIDNIKRRIDMTSKPGAIGYVILLNQSGQPIMYTSVKGKITSGSKRLTKPNQPMTLQRVAGAPDTMAMGPAPSDEGTWGSSGEYIFFWTMDDQYIQWNGGYLYSDKPFRLDVKPLVIDVK